MPFVNNSCFGRTNEMILEFQRLEGRYSSVSIGSKLDMPTSDMKSTFSKCTVPTFDGDGPS